MIVWLSAECVQTIFKALTTPFRWIDGCRSLRLPYIAVYETTAALAETSHSTEIVEGGENACAGHARVPQYTFCLVRQDHVQLGDQNRQGGQI